MVLDGTSVAYWGRLRTNVIKPRRTPIALSPKKHERKLPGADQASGAPILSKTSGDGQSQGAVEACNTVMGTHRTCLPHGDC